ncbi:MAG: hypothetical protein V4757_07055 [Pseudomonadota bacterium]
MTIRLIDRPRRRAALRKFSTWGLILGAAGLAFIVLYPFLPAIFMAQVTPALLTWVANGSLICVIWGLVGVFIDQPKLRTRMMEWALRDRSKP